MVQLLLTIDRYKIAPTNLPTQIIDSIMNVGWSFNQLYIIQTIIDSSDIRNLALERFSFLTSSPRMKLSALLENQSPNQSVLNRLRRNFQKEQHRINAYELIEIYLNMSEFGIIRDENELIQILKTKTLSEKETQYISTVLRDAWDHS